MFISGYIQALKNNPRYFAYSGAAVLFFAMLVILISALNKYSVLFLIALVIFFATALYIWARYAKEKHLHLYPYEYETECAIVRYTFADRNRMCFELLKVIHVTSPVLNRIPVSLSWSGRGEVKVESRLLKEAIYPVVDEKTGEIRFDYPVVPSARFGDVFIMSYKVSLCDNLEQNEPEIKAIVREPAKLWIFEVALEHKNENPDAKLSYVAEKSEMECRIGTTPFNPATRTYRVYLPHPVLGYRYILRWEDDSEAPGQ